MSVNIYHLEGTKEEKLEKITEQHGKMILKLIKNKWGDDSISWQLCIDKSLVAKFRERNTNGT